MAKVGDILNRWEDDEYFYEDVQYSRYIVTNKKLKIVDDYSI